MPIENPRFEEPGAAPGQAQHWRLVTFTARERIAGFGPEPHRAWEDFERWVEFQREFAEGEVALALFDPMAEGYEDFEEGWHNDRFLTELPTGQLVTATFDGDGFESLEAGWDNDAFALAWDDVESIAAVFNAERVEDFDTNWHANETFAWSWNDIISTAATFGPQTDPNEGFEHEWPVATRL